jgi:hypothetical protein
MSWRQRGPRNAQGNPCREIVLAKCSAKGYSRGVKVWQALVILIVLIWIGNTPRRRAIIATTVLLLFAIGIGPQPVSFSR